MSEQDRPVLVLGAGINGAAVARELLLNGVPVVLVDTHDIASGTTAYSSRLIHGGLRYLEFRDFTLVRESLEERDRLLTLAPGFVRPLKLFVPVKNRFGGFLQSARRFLFKSSRRATKPKPRGLWVVRMGLSIYDRFAKDSSLPRHAVSAIPADEAPTFDSDEYRWACSYYDAQIQFPERFVVALLKDGRALANETGIRFEVFPYHEATLDGSTAIIQKRDASARPESLVTRFNPAAVVNATGAWVDRTLSRLNVKTPRLIGGTKGTHIVTRHGDLKERLKGSGVYAEAADGRPIFLLPLGETTLIGTTDLPFDGDPGGAQSSDEEIGYLLSSVNDLFYDLNLSRADIDFHYCGVRPLRFLGASSPAAIPRGHFLTEHDNYPVPLLSVIGGKLTTCRSLAEDVVARLFALLGREVEQTSRDRCLPGDDPFWREMTEKKTSAEFVRSIIRDEWVTHLSDLVERRLMLLYKGGLNRDDLNALVDLLSEERGMDVAEIKQEVSDCIQRLTKFYGMNLPNAAD